MLSLGRVKGLSSQVARRLRRPAPPVHQHPGLSHLGTPYGGWYFTDDESLRGGVVISAGLGEDASFDIELAQRLGCRLVIVDPTPRAISHYQEIQRRLGNVATDPYRSGGKQPVSAYSLNGFDPSSLTLVDRALASTDGAVRLYPPANADHVSYSITDYQHKRARMGDFIEVQAVTYRQLLDEHLDGYAPALIKLDIEGAELEVLPQVLEQPPLQILVEFDELNMGDRASVRDWKALHGELTSAGFVVAHTDSINFTYVHRSLY